MSRRLIARSPDLLRLQNEGYDIAVQGGHLLFRNVPYVNASRTVRLGTLISTLELAGDVTVKPANHVAYWTGEHPAIMTAGRFQRSRTRAPLRILAAA